MKWEKLFDEHYSLQGAIAPQYFSICSESILYFDRINSEEGRFCQIENGICTTLLETDDGQGMLDDMGNLYILKPGQITTLIPVFKDMTAPALELRGLYYDFKITPAGNRILLGNENGQSVVRIVSSNNIEIAALEIKQLMFSSCVAINKDSIFLGGIGHDGKLSIISLNYLGRLEKCWSIDCNSKERIIVKLQFNGSMAIMQISGAYDSLGVLNMESGIFNEIKTEMLGIKTFTDFQVYSDRIYFMDGKGIKAMEVSKLNQISKPTAIFFRWHMNSSACYEYLMYSKAIRSNILPSSPVAIILSSVITFLLLAKGDVMFESYLQQGGFQLMLAVVCLYLICSLKNITALRDKAIRIDNLLAIYNECPGFMNYYSFPAIASITVFSFACLFMYPSYNYYYGMIISALVMIFLSAWHICCVRHLALEREDVIIELLRDDDLETEMCLRAALRKMKSCSSEELCINIAARSNGLVKRTNKWASTRRGIVGGVKCINKSGNIVSVVLDFSNRDIRYSRFSIAMDYISYMKKKMGIDNFQIECNPTIIK